MILLYLVVFNVVLLFLEDYVGDRMFCSVCYIYLLVQLVLKIFKECERVIFIYGDVCKVDDYLDRGDCQQSWLNVIIDDLVICIECECEIEEVFEDDYYCEGFDG